MKTDLRSIEQLDQVTDLPGRTLADEFNDSFRGVQAIIHQTAREKGWWDGKRNDGECLALMHSELSEALEALRNNNPPDDKIPEFSGLEAELADVVIRIMDYAGARHLRVAEALLAKIRYNTTRSHKHGKNF